MKKTSLVVLMVLVVATPCFAEEVEADENFSLHGTEWEGLPTLLHIFPFPWLMPLAGVSVGFHDGKVYRGSGSFYVENSIYVDMPALSIFMYSKHSNYTLGNGPKKTICFGVMLPTGIGMMTIYEKYSRAFIPMSYMQILTKVDDNWIPPESIARISPVQGEQETTFTDVQLVGANTTFQDNLPVEISFDPPDGLTVSNINVISNTAIEFDLEIAINAPKGWRTVIVTYDDGNKLLETTFNVLQIGE